MNLMGSVSVNARRIAAVSVGSLCLFAVCGCAGIGSLNSTVASTSQSIAAAAMMSGTVHGGQSPIYNSTVSLYSAGTSGYGTGATLLATTTTDAGGNFQFTKLANGVAGTGPTGSSWSCPASDPNPDPQIYLTAVGGNTTGTGTVAPNNSAAALIVAIGPCSGLTSSTQVQMNELTTVATVFALAQYINPGSGPGKSMIGTNGTNTSSSTPQGAVGLNNAVAGIVNLVSVAGGTAVTSNTYKGSTVAALNVSTVTVTATPETAKLITIADIIASCINTASSSSNMCADLFASATPPPIGTVTSQPTATFAAAQDTIQAAYYMAVNPIDAGAFTACSTNSMATTNMGCLFGLATSTSPYQTGLSAQPTDWTLGVTYSATGQNCPSNNAFMDSVYREVVDAYGNLWFTADYTHTSTISAISPIGVPIFCKPGTIETGSNYQLTSEGLTIDTAGDIWASWTSVTNNSQIFEVTAPGAVPAASTLTAYPSANLASATQSPMAIVGDNAGNVFYSTWEAPLVITSVAAASGGSTVYSYTSTTTDGNPAPLVGMRIGVSGFGTGFTADNGTFLCTAASATGYSGTSGTGTFTLSNAAGVAATGSSATTASYGTAVYEIPSGTTPTSTGIVSAFIGNAPGSTNAWETGMVDTSGRVYFTNNASGGSQLIELTPPSAAITSYTVSTGSIVFSGANSFTSGQVTISGLTSANGLLLDGQKLTLSAAGASSFTTNNPNPSVLTPGTFTDAGTAVTVPAGTGAAYYATVVNTLGTSGAGVYGGAVDNNNYFYGGFNCCATALPNETVGKVTISPAGTAIATATGNYTLSAQFLGGNAGVRSMALDGADNVWFGNYVPSTDSGTESGSTGIFSIGELATSGGGSSVSFAALSPAAIGLQGSDTCTSSTTGCSEGGGFQKAAFTSTAALAIDPSGNVWVGDFGALVTQFGSGTGNQAITEIMGAAVPVATPLAVAAASGKLASKP